MTASEASARLLDGHALTLPELRELGDDALSLESLLVHRQCLRRISATPRVWEARMRERLELLMERILPDGPCTTEERKDP